MGKCLRRTGRQRRQRPTAAAAAAYLTLRSGRRVPAAASPRRRHRRGGRCCGKDGTVAPQRRRRVLASQAGGEEEVELPPSQEMSPVVVCDEGCGSDRRVPPIPSEAKRDHENDDGVAPRPPTSPPEAEMEAFFAAAELAERRRFAETYNYDVALDRPLQGRFEWSPASTYVK